VYVTEPGGVQTSPASSAPVSTVPPLSLRPPSLVVPPSSGDDDVVVLEQPNAIALTKPAQPATVIHFFNDMPASYQLRGLSRKPMKSIETNC
jgi:hypothetical protein